MKNYSSNRVISAITRARAPLYVRRKLIESLLFVLFVDASLFVVLFRGIPIFSGIVAFGNLPAFYPYGAIPVSEIEQLILYPLFVQLLSHVVDVIIAPSLVFFPLMFLPSFAIFFFMDELSNNKIFSIFVGIAFGTPLNPLLLGQFVGGSFMAFTWLFFLFVSFSLLIRFIKSKKSLLLILSAVFYALATTSGGDFPVGIYLSFPFIFGLFIVNISKRSFKFMLVNFFRYVAISASLLLPEAVSTISSNIPALSSGTSKGIIGAYIRSVINFEYTHYSISKTLLDSVYIPTNGFLSNTYWYALTALMALSAIIFIMLRVKSKNSGIIKFGFLMYFLSSMVIILFHYNLLVNLFIHIGIFDQLDYPYDFLQMQQIALVMMGIAMIELSAQFAFLLHTFYFKSMRFRSNVAPPLSSIRQNLRKNSSIILVTLLTFLVILAAAPIVTNTPAIFHTDQGNPFIPSYYNNVHSYLSTHNDIGKQTLVLPNTEGMLVVAGTIMPSQYIWNPPQPLPSYGGSFNITEYIEILSTPHNGSFQAFGYMLGLSGVKLVLVSAKTSQTTLIPSGATYSTGTSVSINTTELIASLNTTSYFRLVYTTHELYLYEVVDNFSASNVSGGLATFDNQGIINVSYGNILTNSSYTNFGGYYSQYDHYVGNRDFTIEYNASSPIGYNMLYLGQSLSIDNKSGAQRNFDLSGNLNLTRTDSLDIFILLYSNETSTFWNESSRINFQTLDTNSSFSFDFSIPRNIVKMNLVFYATGKNSSTFYLSNISMLEQLISSNVATNLSLQVSLFNHLINNRVIDKHSFLIPAGMGNYANYTTRIYAAYDSPYNTSGKYFAYSFPIGNISLSTKKFINMFVYSNKRISEVYFYNGGKLINSSKSNISFVSASLENLTTADITIYSAVPLTELGIAFINLSIHGNIQRIGLPKGNLYFSNGSVEILVNSNNSGSQLSYINFSLFPFFIIVIASFIKRVKIK